jgi:hypothetical protein
VSDTPNLGGIQWDQYNHQAMWDMVESADPKDMLNRADELDTLAKRMGDNVNAAYQSMQKLMSTWSGPAAEQSASVVQPLLDWASGAATTGSQIAGRLGHYAEALNRARLAMPAPVDPAQLDAVANGQAVTVGPVDMNEPELTAMANGDTATQAQAAAAKAKAVEVMQRFEQESASAYHGMPTFTRPPQSGKFPSPEPAPEPPIPPAPPGPPRPTPPPAPVTPPTTTDPQPPPSGSDPSSGTSASDYTGPAGLGVDLGTGSGAASPGTGAGLGSGLGNGLGNGVIGVTGLGAGAGPASGVGEQAATQRAGALAAEEAAEQSEWRGFAPMPMNGGRGGDRDGEHHNDYGQESNVIGELPAAFPPVLGL